MLPRTFAALAAFVFLPSAAVAAEPAGSSVIVSGHGQVRVAPDQVVIELTVTTTDDDLLRVRENSDKNARTILTHARKHSVGENGFEVSRLELLLDYNEQLRRQIYEVERDVTLRLDDLTKLDALLSDLLGERNLQVVGINFVTSKARQHEFEARRRAVADAKEKAAHLAELNGLRLGNAREIHMLSESEHPFVTSVIPVMGSAEPRGARNIKRDSKRAAKDVPTDSRVRFAAFQPAKDEAKADGKPFALGMIEITADVEIDFELVE